MAEAVSSENSQGEVPAVEVKSKLEETLTCPSWTKGTGILYHPVWLNTNEYEYE